MFQQSTILVTKISLLKFIKINWYETEYAMYIYKNFNK